MIFGVAVLPACKSSASPCQSSRALNHVAANFRGIVGVYQTHDYANEVCVACRLWGNHIEGLVSGKPAKVLPISGRRR